MPRHDGRYEATPEDVIYALRHRDPDHFGHNDTPHTDFFIASWIADDKHLQGHPLGRVLQRNKLVTLLAEMARDGRIVGKTNAEWADLGRTPPSRSREPLYTSLERAEAWGIRTGPRVERWTLTVEFDDQETQSTADPELTFPRDECSQVIAFIGEHWGLMPEDIQEMATWTPERLVIQFEQLDFATTVVNWLGLETIPKSITITRNETR
jgi:hypothetical protein